MRSLAFLVLLSSPAWAQTVDQQLMTQSPAERVPAPDPTRLTTAQLVAAIAQLTAQIKAADESALQLTDERFRSMERATDLRLQVMNRVPEMVKESVEHALELIYAKLDQQNEKFISINSRLDETRRNADQLAAINAANVDRTSGLIDTAINKAFASAEQARATSENTTKAQIESQGEIQRTNNENSDRLIRDLNDRLTRMESRQIGVGEAKSDQNDNTGMLIGAAGVAIAGLALAFGMSRRAPEPQIRYLHAPGQVQVQPGVTTTTNTAAA